MCIRAVTLADVPAICDIHRGSDGPWVDPVECAVYVNHRLLRPFHCRVLECRGQVVGHAEWIVNREPNRAAPSLYLGMLHVRADSQRQGVGRHLIEDGLHVARQQGCDTLRTVPDDAAVEFYERCGFAHTASARSYRLPVKGGRPTGWRRARSVPARASRALHLRLGWVQACSSHMWEICNQPAVLATEAWSHPCLVATGAAAYVQIRYRDDSQALPVAWANRDTPLEALLAAAQALASARQIKSLLLAVGPEDKVQIADAEPAGEILVMARPICQTPTDR